MSVIIFFCVILLNSLFVHCVFDPSKIDYCKLKCVYPENIPSAACNCKQAINRFDIVSHPIEEFRQTMLDEHNLLRNQIASGAEMQTYSYPSASDMFALNYDLELEHVARCYVLNAFTGQHDKCRMTSYCAKGEYGGGQNLYGVNRKHEDMEAALKGIHIWYDELSIIKKENRVPMIDNFTLDPNLGAGHFTEMVWGSQRKIGCARVWLPDNNHPIYKYTLICNYAGPDEYCTSNMIGDKMYSRGNPCSQCGKGVLCNNETGGNYSALCGEIKPVPTDPLPKLQMGGKGGSSGSSKMQRIMDTLGVFMVLVAVIGGCRGKWI